MRTITVLLLLALSLSANAEGRVMKCYPKGNPWPIFFHEEGNTIGVMPVQVAHEPMYIEIHSVTDDGSIIAVGNAAQKYAGLTINFEERNAMILSGGQGVFLSSCEVSGEGQ